jgi:hypothetical protein
VHAVEHGWPDRVRTVELFGYRLPAETSEPFVGEPHASVPTRTVRPLGAPERVGDLLALHEADGCSYGCWRDPARSGLRDARP